jgi:hypothetical protein
MPVSKSRRQPKKPARTSAGDGATRSMPAHAHLLDATDRVMGGIALRDEEWVVVLQGRVVAATESAGLAIAMLRHTATLLSGAGHAVRVDTSETLRARATEEGAAAGKSLDDYLAYLEAERAELARERGGGDIHTA